MTKLENPMVLLDMGDAELMEIFEEMKTRFGYDFTGYSKASLKRRVARFMEMKKIVSLADLAAIISTNSNTFNEFVMEITVNVTEMFRDPTFYQALRSKVVPYLKTFPYFHIWHAGCSTGEEVYSMAILLHEEEILHRAQIYGTDINSKVIDTAKDGIIPLRNMKENSQNYLKSGGKQSLSDYYTVKYQNAIIKNELRKNFIFSKHNLVNDRSFNEFNLIICRNLMIYFDEDFQNRSIKLFLDSMPMRGYLALGSKESMRFNKYRDHFEVVDGMEKIFRRIK